MQTDPAAIDDGLSADSRDSCDLITHTFFHTVVASDRNRSRDGDADGDAAASAELGLEGDPDVSAAQEASTSSRAPLPPSCSNASTDRSSETGGYNSEDDDDDAWSSADEDKGVQPDDQTCLRGGDTAAPRTLIETLSSTALRRLLSLSGAAYAVAILYTVVLVAIGHVYVVTIPSEFFGVPGFTGQVLEIEVLPHALMIIHVVLGSVFLTAIVVAAITLSAHVWAVPRARRADEQVWTIVLLWAAAIYAVPVTEYEALALFRFFETGDESVLPDDASETLLIFLAMGAVSFAGFILWYGFTTVASFRKLEGTRGRLRFYLPRTLLLVAHVALRINAYVSLPGTTVAFSIFPVASVAYLLRFVVARPVAAPLTDEPLALAIAVVVIGVEVLLVGVLCVEMRLTSHVLGRASFVHTRRKLVAYRFYRIQARRMAVASSLCVLLTAVAPPIALYISLQRLDVILFLTEVIGHGPPFRLLVTTYVLVEAILALPPHVTGVRALFSRPRRLASSWELEQEDEVCSNASIASSVSAGRERRGAKGVLAGGRPGYHTRLRETFLPLPEKVGDEKGVEGGGRRGRDRSSGLHTGGCRRVGGRYIHASHRRDRRCLEIRPGTFVLTTAAKLLNLSWLAYDEPPPPSPYLCPRFAWRAADPIAAVKRIYHSPTDTLVLFVTLPDRLVLAFRGTVSVTNTKTDLAISFIPLETVFGADTGATLTAAADAATAAAAAVSAARAAASSGDVPAFPFALASHLPGVGPERGSDVEAPLPPPLGATLPVGTAVPDVDTATSRARLWASARVHSGFGTAYAAVRGEVVATFLTMRSDHPHLPWLITGHSLGGALACLAALDIAILAAARELDGTGGRGQGGGSVAAPPSSPVDAQPAPLEAPAEQRSASPAAAAISPGSEERISDEAAEVADGLDAPRRKMAAVFFSRLDGGRVGSEDANERGDGDGSVSRSGAMGGLLTSLSMRRRLQRPVCAPPPPWLSVTTYGAPKVGNAAWVSLLDSLVPEHWRCVVANDVITTIPPFRAYAHAGTTVLLDLAGDLFIDPLTATKRTLHGGSVSIRFHGRFAYMFALSAVGISRFHGSSARRRLFWRWPLPPMSRHLLAPPPRPKFHLACLAWDADMVTNAPTVSLARDAAASAVAAAGAVEAAAGAVEAAAEAVEAAAVSAVDDVAEHHVWGSWTRRWRWWKREGEAVAARRPIPPPVIGRWARLVAAARVEARAAEVAAHPRRARRLRPLPPLRPLEDYIAAATAATAAAASTVSTATAAAAGRAVDSCVEAT
ncbi:hypothetical protein MMPV_005808 [Pyropia vietnamensis]